MGHRRFLQKSQSPRRGRREKREERVTSQSLSKALLEIRKTLEEAEEGGGHERLFLEALVPVETRPLSCPGEPQLSLSLWTLETPAQGWRPRAVLGSKKQQVTKYSLARNLGRVRE